MSQQDLGGGYEAAAADHATTPVLPRRRVLVVDDEEGVRGVVARVLEKAGFQVVEAEDGPGALALLQAQAGGFAAAVVDVSMPGLRGDVVVHAMRQAAPLMRVVLMSGYREDEAIPEGRTRPDAFLRKPFLPDDLRRVMRTVLVD